MQDEMQRKWTPGSVPILEPGKMDDQRQEARASGFRYVMEVMDERTHLGLNNETADKLREILARRTAKAEAPRSRLRRRWIDEKCQVFAQAYLIDLRSEL